MAVLLFVLFWAILAAGLLALGLFGARKGSNKPVRRGGRGWWGAAFLFTLAIFGVAVPIAAGIGAHNDSKDIPKSGISDLSSNAEHGRELFAKYCSLCHTLSAANAVASVGPNLDNLRPTKALVLNAIHNGRARGNGAMARDLVVGQDAEDVAEFVSQAVGQTCK